MEQNYVTVTVRVLTDVAEVSAPAVQADAASVLGAFVVTELVVSRAARQITAASVVAAVAQQAVGDPRSRRSTVTGHRRRRVADQYRLPPLATGVDGPARTQPRHHQAPCTTRPVPAMKPEAIAIGDPQDGRWKITLMFDRAQVLRTEIFRSSTLQQTTRQ